MFKLLATGAILVAVGLGLTIVGGVISGEGINMHDGFNDLEMADPYITDATGVGTIDVQVENRRVVVQPAIDDQITITYAESTRDKIEITNEGGVLTLTNDVNHWFWFTMNFGMMTSTQERTVTVSIPSTLAVDLSVETENGTLIVSDLPEATSLDLNSVNGNIALTNLSGLATVDAVTTNGEISLENVTVTSAVELSTANGTIDLDGVSSPTIRATTSNGEVKGQDITGEDVTFHSVNGNVELEIHGELSDFYVKLSTVNGSMYIDGSKVTQNAYNTNLPDKLDLSTTNGSVRLNFVA